MAITRSTKSLRAVRSAFGDTSRALSAVDLITQFRGAMNKTTVYRILERLEAERFIHSFTDGNGLTWYAKCKECSDGEHHDIHPHFQCKSCGKTKCLTVDLALPALPGHRIESVELLFTGECSDCCN